MPSTTIYPPILEGYTPAFSYTSDSVRVYFTLSKFSPSSSNDLLAHVSIKKQGNSKNYVNTANTNKPCATGIILNVPVGAVENSDLKYVEIKKDYLLSGFTQGWLYQVQIRLTTEECSGTYITAQAAWLKENAQYFSEWSNISILKATGKITIPNPSILTPTDIIGHYENTDDSEPLNSYRLVLKKNNEILEDSGILYPNKYVDINQFQYQFHINPEPNITYTIDMEYDTLNGYKGTTHFSASTNTVMGGTNRLEICTLENNNYNLAFEGLCEEEDEGRIGLKVFDATGGSVYHLIRIKRTSSLSNFTRWEIIKTYNEGTVIDNSTNYSTPIFYDYTIESGIWYKYGVEVIQDVTENETTQRKTSSLKITENPIMRDFNFTYLLGEEEQQLKLSFNNTISNFKINLSDTKVDTIGGKYPFITRNGNMNYISFSLGGLISFYSDEKNTFTNQYIVYGNEDIVELYNRYNETIGNSQLNPIYEKDFRKAVINFLNDGKPKLFKSRTEGNIVVRLMNVNLTPEQSIGRVVYSFSAEAIEVAEPNMATYEKYKFFNKESFNGTYIGLNSHVHRPI